MKEKLLEVQDLLSAATGILDEITKESDGSMARYVLADQPDARMVPRFPEVARSHIPDISPPATHFGIINEVPTEFPGKWDPSHAADKYNRMLPSGWDMHDGVYDGWISGHIPRDEDRRPYPMLKVEVNGPFLVSFETKLLSMNITDDQWAHLFSVFHREWDNTSITMVPAPMGVRLSMTGGITDLISTGDTRLPMNKWFTVQLWVDYAAGAYKCYLDGKHVLSAPKPHTDEDKAQWMHWGMYTHGSITSARMLQRGYKIESEPNDLARQKWGV